MSIVVTGTNEDDDRIFVWNLRLVEVEQGQLVSPLVATVRLVVSWLYIENAPPRIAFVDSLWVRLSSSFILLRSLLSPRGTPCLK